MEAPPPRRVTPKTASTSERSRGEGRAPGAGVGSGCGAGSGHPARAEKAGTRRSTATGCQVRVYTQRPRWEEKKGRGGKEEA